MGESCVVFTHWEQLFIPFWNLGVPNYIEQWFKEYFERPRFLHWFVRMTQNLSLLCFCSGWGRRHQNKIPKQLWEVKRLKIFAFSTYFGRLAEVLTTVFRKILYGALAILTLRQQRSQSRTNLRWPEFSALTEKCGLLQENFSSFRLKRIWEPQNENHFRQPEHLTPLRF